MVDIKRILAAPDVVSLRSAVATAFEELSLETTNSEKIAELETRVSAVEGTI